MKTTVLDFVRDEIRNMQGYVSGEQPASGKYIKLNTNENPFQPSHRAIDAIHDAASSGLNVYPDALATAFRMVAAAHHAVQPENIICGNGSDDILTILTRTFVSPGHRIRVAYPSYILYRTLAAIQGAGTEEIHFDQEWNLPESFGDAGEALDLVFLPNPNSPSGTSIPLERLAKFANQLNCPLVVDEAYADFSRQSAVGLIDDHPNVIVTRTLSKSHALAGLRFGYGIASAELVSQMLKVKDSYNCDSLSIAGATAALADTQWLAEHVEQILKTREDLTRNLRRLGFEVTASDANFVWCRHPDHSAQSVYQTLKDNHILVRYMDYPNWGDGLRISVGTHNQISALITILQSIIGS